MHRICWDAFRVTFPLGSMPKLIEMLGRFKPAINQVLIAIESNGKNSVTPLFKFIFIKCRMKNSKKCN